MGESLRKWLDEHPIQNPDPDFKMLGMDVDGDAYMDNLAKGRHGGSREAQ